jgi:hypothetical protein
MAAGDVENGLQGGPCQPAGRVPPAGEEPMPLAPPVITATLPS